MLRRGLPALLTAVLGVGIWSMAVQPAAAEGVPLNRYYYYPYYYFPHNYWPAQGPQWPEKMGSGYVRPPAYMAYPAFREPHWRYDLFEPAPYYRGFHFWLDQF